MSILQTLMKKLTMSQITCLRLSVSIVLAKNFTEEKGTVEKKMVDNWLFCEGVVDNIGNPTGHPEEDEEGGEDGEDEALCPLCPIGSPLGDPGPLGDLFVDLGPL